MASNKKQPEQSPGGSPIYRYETPTPFVAPGGSSSIPLISEHIERYLGKAQTVFHEVVSDTVHIDIHPVIPTPLSPYMRLVTSGMSDLPMRVPDAANAPRYLELMMTLPQDWRLDSEALKDERWYWPVRLLKTLARFPQKYQTWLGFGHTFPNGDPPAAYASDTGFCGAILLPPVSAPEQFLQLQVTPEKQIMFLAAVPLYAEEIDMKLRSGMDKLLDRLAEAKVSDIVDIARPNVATRKKWFGFV